MKILQNKVFKGLIYLCFLIFVCRIIVKDVLYQLLSFDNVYLKYCRCYKGIDSFFVIQALIFDIFDFCLSLAVLYHIYRVA